MTVSNHSVSLAWLTLVKEGSVSVVPYVAEQWCIVIFHLLGLFLNAYLSYLIALSGSCALNFSFLDRAMLC